MSFKLTIGQGHITLFAPVRDSAARVIPGQLGEFIVRLAAGEVYSVTGYNGNADLGFVYVQSGSIELYHAGLIPTPSANPPLRLIGSVLPAHINSTLYGTPRNLTPLQQRPLGPRQREQFTLAVEIQKRTEQRVKKIKLSIGVDQTTLRHNGCMSENSWLMQLIDLFDVKVRIRNARMRMAIDYNVSFFLLLLVRMPR